MDWSEIKKAVFEYMETWTETSIVWPMQSVKPTADRWIEIHIIDNNEDFRRKNNAQRGMLLLQIGIFAKDENQYALDTLYSELSDFLGQHDICSDNYSIRFQNLGATDVPWSRGKNHVENIVQFRAVTIEARIWEKL